MSGVRRSRIMLWGLGLECKRSSCVFELFEYTDRNGACLMTFLSIGAKGIESLTKVNSSMERECTYITSKTWGLDERSSFHLSA